MLNVECSPRSSRGVALVITLIMLAVITFMATTFLVLSRRESNSVTTNTDQTTARFTADSALERAKVELLAGIIATGNDQNFDLMVPTNFFNPFGFDPALPAASNPYLNVNYDYTLAPGHLALTPLQQQQNIANLLYNPRPPVLILNRLTGVLEPRYYLDLNRNGMFDATGSISNVINVAGTLVTNGNIGVVGDPQWIGVLQFPDRPHSADNKFLARWTYLVLPAGKTLDVNYLHNQAYNPSKATLDVNGGDYQRNQGVGTWEMNLAAFLYDLNTNTAPQGWGGVYTYDVLNPSLRVVTGNAFADAEAIYRYRLNGPVGNFYNVFNLNSASSMFQGAALPFVNDGIDQYSDGELMRGIWLDETSNQDPVVRPWPGADNSYHFFTSQDFFDPNKVAVGIVPPAQSFADRLINAGASLDSYNRYTFYRMLAQLGTDSAPMKEDKLNLNYQNVDASGNVVAGMETNLIAWQPLQFFTNAAARMFEKLDMRDNNNNLVTVTNIPVWPPSISLYTPAINRILQLAANMTEVATNGIFPSVYRPFFKVVNGTNYFIAGYELVNSPDEITTGTTFLTLPLDLNVAINRTQTFPSVDGSRNINFYGVPWIIGAKKGLPNFNQVIMQSASQITRKIKMHRPDLLSDPDAMAQMYIVGISNVVGVSVWNSYATNYPRPVYIQADGVLTMSLTNNLGARYPTAITPAGLGGASSAITLGVQRWSGCGVFSGSSIWPRNQSFQVPLFTNYVFLPDSAYQHTTKLFVHQPPDPSLDWPNALGITPDFWPQPMWQLEITNQIRCMIFAGGSAGRIIDYVQLSGLDSHRSLTLELQDSLNSNARDTGNLWGTNRMRYLAFDWPMGIKNQFDISRGGIANSDSEWQNNVINPLVGQARLAAIASFKSFIGYDDSVPNTNLVMQFPFCPTAKRYQTVVWSANDPLVHYLTSDLADPSNPGYVMIIKPPTAPSPSILTNLHALATRYSPWGGNPLFGQLPSAMRFDTALKDPLVMGSDNWNFPTNQPLDFSWIGQVHRGTPWQTIYLKSADILSTDLVAWMKWSGSANAYTATNLAPINDRQMVGVLISLLNTNDPRQQLSVNHPNPNAWLGVLDGFIVQTNDPVQVLLNSIVVSSNSPEAGIIVNGITQKRLTQPSGYFHNIGDLLAVPELTDASPFLDTTFLSEIDAGAITDEALEKIPTQLLPLLRLDSVGSLNSANGPLLLQFTGDDNYSYAVEASSNLVDWVRLSTNQPVNGVFSFGTVAPMNVRQQFYRSVLLP